MPRVALILKIKPGKEEAYREFVQNFPLDKTRHLFDRYGINQHTVMTAGDTIVAYYEADDPFSVHRLFRDTETLAMMISTLGDIVDLDPYGGTIYYEELFTWKRDEIPPQLSRAASILKTRPGQEKAYREFSANFPMHILGPLYDRHGVHQHTLLMAGDTIITYYESDDPSSVERLFSDEETLAHMKQLLSDAIYLDAPESSVLYHEQFTWKREGASSGAAVAGP